MSLINQMLKDLEQRRAQLPPGDSLRGLHAAPGMAVPARRWPTVLLAMALTGSGFGVWLADALGPSVVSLPQANVPPLAAPTATATPAMVAVAPPAAAAAPAAESARADAGNAAEYAGNVDSAWDREWLADMNTAVSVAALEEQRADNANTREPPAEVPPKATTPEKPLPPPPTSPSTSVAAATTGSMHKTPHNAAPQTQADQQYATAVGALRMGDHRSAETALRGALTTLPGHGAATQALTALLLQQGRRSEADSALAEALAAHPQQPALIMLRARLLAESGQDRAAVGLLQTRDDAESLALLGALQQRLGADAAAARAYRRALANAPQQGAWWLGLAISLERSQQSAAALEAYRRALADARLDAQVNRYVRARIAALSSGEG